MPRHSCTGNGPLSQESELDDRMGSRLRYRDGKDMDLGFEVRQDTQLVIGRGRVQQGTI